MRTGRLGRVVLVVGLVVGCGAMDTHRPLFHEEDDDLPAFSAARLGDRFDEDSAADFLDPSEREALKRSQMGQRPSREERLADRQSKLDDPQRPPQSGFGHALDEAGKASLSLFGVGLTLAAAAAPYLLF